MDGFHTVIELATLATVRFEGRNMLLFDGLEYKVLGTFPQEEIDLEDPPDDAAYGSGEPSLILESQAKRLLVQTLSFTRIGHKDQLCVYRLEKLVMAGSVPSLLQVLPYTGIEGYFSVKMQTLEQSVQNHAALVQRVVSDFSANNPKISYDGPIRWDVLMNGEREVSERIDKRSQAESAAYWAKKR